MIGTVRLRVAELRVLGWLADDPDRQRVFTECLCLAHGKSAKGSRSGRSARPPWALDKARLRALLFSTPDQIRAAIDLAVQRLESEGVIFPPALKKG